MAKLGLTGNRIESVLASAAASSGWSLCVGAGTSRGPFPTWDELVLSLIASWADGISDSARPDAVALAKTLRGEFTADAVIQAAQDRLDLNDAAFAAWLSERLYSDIRT